MMWWTGGSKVTWSIPAAAVTTIYIQVYLFLFELRLQTLDQGLLVYLLKRSMS